MARKANHASARRSRKRARRVAALFFGAEWALMFGFWLLLVDNFKLGDVLLGAAAALVSAAAATLLEAAIFGRFAPHLTEIAQGWRIPWYVVDETWEIFAVLAKTALGKPAASLLRSVRFDPGGDDAHSAGRRALAVALSTAPPNFVAIGIDRQNRKLIFHQVKASSVPIMTQKLGARP